MEKVIIQKKEFDTKELTTMESKIVQKIKEYDHVSFAELNRWFPEHFNGNYVWMLNDQSNIQIWHGMSKIFLYTLMELVDQGTIYMNLATAFVYLHDGLIVDLPVAEQPPKIGYKKTHWLPVVFSIHPNKKTITPVNIP